MFIEQQKQIDNYMKKQDELADLQYSEVSLLEKVHEAPKQEYNYTIDQIERKRLVNMLINRNNRLSNMTTLLLRTFLNKMF